MMKSKVLVFSMTFALGLSAALQAGAAATAAQAAQLGVTLTPMGGEKAANKEGSIPAWNGGITKPPVAFTPGKHVADPFPADKPQFVISAANFMQYKDKLSAGQVAMFGRYKTYAMPVYASRRSAAFAQKFYDWNKKNATTAKLSANGEGVENIAIGIPFPIPSNGAEIMWNHRLKFKGYAIKRYNNQAIPTPTGQYTMIRVREEQMGLYWRDGKTLADINNVLQYFYQVVESPARLAGSALLVHEALDATKGQRQAWVYNPGQRRVRKAPNVGYDNPGTASDGMRTNDMLDMFNGPMDRYTWKLVGKKEMFIPYNSYKAHAGGVNMNDLVKPGHLNPNYMRYELHRVWVVEATLSAGKRHINPRRTFYFDEDSWQIVAVDHYDAAGKMWRVSEGHNVNYYDQPLLWTTIEAHYDLKSGRYIAVGLDNNESAYDFSFITTPDNFSPQAMRTRGVR
jgi:hypothetical protein